MLYKLVENNVSYAGTQFTENLKFNSETLANVLYDNIYTILGEKVEDGDFTKWVADELVQRGCVFKSSGGGEGAAPGGEPKEEVVHEIDTSEYDKLVANVQSAVDLLRASRLRVLQILVDVDEQTK